jgi:uncharacterized protein (TIGR03435 family)
VLWSWWRQWLPVRAALRRATRVQLDPHYGAADLPVLTSPAMPEPGVVGIFRQWLVLPEGVVERLTPAQLRALIAHELCHVRCHDNLAAALQMLVEALFWFHPAVWWIERRLVAERERACDEAVLQAGNRPSDYAEGLLAVCRQSIGLRLPCVTGVNGGATLRARVESIMRNEIGYPLTPVRRCALAVGLGIAVCGPIAGGALTAQSQVVVPATVAFESVSIKRGNLPPARLGPNAFDVSAFLLKRQLSRPAPSLAIGTAGIQDSRTLKIQAPLHVLIQAAYNATRFQVEGGPSWVGSDDYAIEARAADGTPAGQMRDMLQSLLADRFKLTLRRETKVVPVYELMPADGGLRISAMRAGECTVGKDIRWDLIDLEAPLFVCDSFRRRVLSQSPETRPRPRWPRVDRIEMGGVSIPTFIEFISSDVDRLVVDKTGFTSPFNLLLDFARPAYATSGAPAPSGPTIFAAVEDQLGLRLMPAEAPVEVLVIDRVEPPVEN